MPSAATVTANDACDGLVAVNYQENESNPGSDCNNVIVRTWTAVDACGNSSSCTQTITIDDTVAPQITGVGNSLTVECGTELPFSQPGITDNCDSAPVLTLVDAVALGACAHSYSVTRTWTGQDACGNTATASQTITVVDTTPPVIDGQGANATIECPAAPEFTAPNATDLCDSAPQVIEVSDATVPGNCAGSYVRTKTWKAVDACGNESGTVSQTIAVVDTTAPAITGQGANQTIECPASPEFTAPSATDACDANAQVIVVSDITTPGNCAGTYSRAITWKAVDCSNNQSDPVSQIITVVDTTAPSIIQPAAGQTVECDGAGNLAALNAWLTGNGSAAAIDSCSNITWSNDFAGLASACGNTGSATVTFTATDDCGNASTTAATFTIVDTTAPVINAFPPDATGQCIADISEANTSLVSATDACGTVSITHLGDANNGGAGCVNDPYIVTRTYRATDACGNFVDQSQTITIIDTIAPVIADFPSDVLAQCQAEIPPVEIGLVNATDNCLGPVTVSHVGDASNGGAGCVNDPLVLVRTYRVTDSCGNTVDQSQTITVIDTIAPQITANATGVSVECDGAGNVSDLNQWLNSRGGATAHDNCSDVSWSHDFAGLSGSCGSTGSATFTFTASDACGNTSTTVATFTIVDTTPPSIGLAAANQTVECDGAGNLADLNAWLANNGGASASDSCGGVNWTNNFNALSYDCGASGSVTVTFTASDECGNSSQTAATFTIVDTTPPSITLAASNAVAECDGAGNTAALAAWLANHGGAQANDVCGGVHWSHDFTQLIGGCGTTGFATVTFTATDDCGNASSTTATFAIVDTAPPHAATAAGVANVSLECDDSAGLASALSFAPTFVDQCSGAALANLIQDVTAPDANCANALVRIRKWTATDACGNESAAYVQTINVVDTTAPVIATAIGAGDGTLECSDATGISAALAFVPSFTDNCTVALSAVLVFDQSITDAGCPNAYTRVRRWVASDGCGNTSDEYEQTISIVDTTAPVLAPCPANIAVSCSVNATVPVSFTLPSAIDNCGPALVTASPPSGSNFPIGSTPVTITATDACGNTTTCSFSVNRSELEFQGFFSPIDGADGTGGSFEEPLRTFKWGSTVPFKFKATCGGGTVLTGVHTLQAIKYSNATSNDPPMDATPTGGATTGNQFVLTGDQWHFNLNTKPLSSGTWKFIATLSDGSKHSVWLILKK